MYCCEPLPRGETKLQDHMQSAFSVQVTEYVYSSDYVHQVNPETPIEETMRALAELKAEGKIEHIGLSAVSSATLRRACKIAPVAAVQVEYSPIVLDIEGPAGTDLLTTCRELGVAVVAAMPLGRGMLTSTFVSGEALGDGKDKRPRIMPRFMGANRDKNVKLVSQFEGLAHKKGCTTPQLALAWLLKQGDDVLPIPGTKKLKYLEENWGALKVHLTDEDETEIRHFVETAEVAGHYMPPHLNITPLGTLKRRCSLSLGLVIKQHTSAAGLSSFFQTSEQGKSVDWVRARASS